MILPLLLPLAADAATFDVCATCPYTTVSAAVSAARDGDVIRIAAGVYDEGGASFGGNLTVVGAGSNLTRIRTTGDYFLRVGPGEFDDEPELRISSLSLESATRDGIVVHHGTAYVTDVRAENVAGTAIEVDGDLTVEDCVFVANATAVHNYEISWPDAHLTVRNSTFESHTGSAVATYLSDVLIEGCHFASNSDPYLGGAVDAEHSTVSLEGNTLRGNSAPEGGAVWVGGGAGTALRNNLFCGNEADTGGSVMVDWGAELESVGNVFAGNSAASAGGDVYLARDDDGSGSGWFAENTFVGAHAPMGGSIWSDVDVVFRFNIVAHTSEYGLYGTAGIADISHNDFWEVAPDAVGGTWPGADGTNLYLDPMFPYYVDGGCEELDLNTQRWYRDDDGDGFGLDGDVVFGPTQPAGYAAESGDCDDGDAGRHPRNEESCDGIDQDCDNSVDESATDAPEWRRDQDEDGFQGARVTRVCEAPAGWAAPSSGEADCDDADPTVYPGAPEICDDGVDQDCDGGDLEPPSWRPDADGDGYQAQEFVDDCEQPQDWGRDNGPPYDCNDDDSSVFPGADEVASDRLDQDCDGLLTDVADGGCGGCTTSAAPSRALLILAALVLRRRRAGPY